MMKKNSSSNFITDTHVSLIRAAAHTQVNIDLPPDTKGSGYTVAQDGHVQWDLTALMDEHDRKTASTPVDPYHYNSFAIEPLDYIMSNGMGFADGNVVKYVTRFAVTGNVMDLKKAKRYIEVLIERAEGE